MHKHTPHLSTPHDHRCPPTFSGAVVVRNVVGGLCKRLVVLMHTLVMSVNCNALRLLVIRMAIWLKLLVFPLGVVSFSPSQHPCVVIGRWCEEAMVGLHPQQTLVWHTA